MAQIRNLQNRGGWCRLGVFWLTVLLLMATGGGVLEWLGPPSGARGLEASTPGTADVPISGLADAPTATGEG